MQHDREAQFARLLSEEHLHAHSLRAACLHGIPENADLRAEAWRALLGVVELADPATSSPNNVNARAASKQRKRKQYRDLAHDLLPADTSADLAAGSRTPQDSWLDDIDKDVRRTQTSYAFFSQLAPRDPEDARQLPRSIFNRLNTLHPHRQSEINERYNLSPRKTGSMGETSSALNSSDNSPGGEERNFERLIRMLYIYALLNPVHYVQGMSELIAPLYYVFCLSSENQEAEADCFWAFSTLMAEIGDFYVQDSDGSFNDSQATDTPSSGITGLGAALRRYAKQLHWIDAELAYDLHTRKEIQPTFYALRWITCLLAMDFRIPDLIRVWDSLFSMLADTAGKPGKATSRGESEARAFLLDLCVAMVLIKRHELLSSSFSSCISTLQNYVCEDVHTVLTLAFSIRERRITSSLTGMEISSYSSVPNSPVVDGGDFDAFPSTPGPNLSNARQTLANAASSLSANPTARALRQRLFKQREVDFPDDASDISNVTAPGALERIWTSPTQSSTNTSPATTMPSSASSLFNKYAKTLVSSDTAAQLNKMTTNSYIAALQLKESAPSTFSKWRNDMSTKVNGAAGAAKTMVRPPSPQMDPPFTPPTTYAGRWLSPEGTGSPSVVLGERRGSGPKPLLLSSSARRASATLQQDNQSASPLSASRRTSYSGPTGSSMGLGLPQSLDHSLHRSRTPSPTTAFRPGTHVKAASASQAGSYKIGNGRNGHFDHSRTGSLVTGQPLSPYRHEHSLSQISEQGNTSLEDDVPLAKLSIGSANSPNTTKLERPLPMRPASRSGQFSLLRDKGASNDLEILDDTPGIMEDSGASSSMSHFFQNTGLTDTSASLITPPQSPRLSIVTRHTSVSDDMPLSPTGGSSTLSRSVHRQPRTSSLSNIHLDDGTPVSPSQSMSLASGQIEGDSATAPQRPSRRKLASSRRLPRRDSVGSASGQSVDIDSARSSLQL